MEDVFTSVQRACQALNLGKTTLYKLIGAGALKTTKLGRRRLVSVESVRALRSASDQVEAN